MKQILQNLANGQTELADIPCPQVKSGHLLIHTTKTLVSAGTERMLVDFGKANLINKARQQPDKVRQVLDKAKTEGVLTTLDTVRSKLDQPLALGYCNVGTVLDVGAGVNGFQIGERVVSNGKHAEVVAVPKNLCARIPDAVSDEQAAFTVLAAIGLQGIRLAQPTLGESVVVSGLGLIGLLAVRLLRAQGCRVLGLDFDPNRLELAEQFGAEVVNLGQTDPLAAAEAFSRSRGVDAVLITASTQSSEPVSQAANMCRQRGRIVLVGVTGLELSRADFYEKELSFQVSCSYGPGRYDPAYEEQGHDYPIGFVRWTEQRNFEAVLDLMTAGKLDLEPLISHRFALEDAEKAYQLLAGDEPSLGIMLDYPVREAEGLQQRLVVLPKAVSPLPPHSSPTIGFIGAGNYAGRVLIPAFAKTNVVLHTLATSGGVSAVHYGRKYRFRQASTDTEALLADPQINTVVIATRHDSHARYVLQALRAGKHVFVEKPLCLTLQELAEIKAVYQREIPPNPPLAKGGTDEGATDDAVESPSPLAPHPSPSLMVGFNRRFAPQVQRIKALLDSIDEPKSFIMTVNAGVIPPDHWTQDLAVGGGRVIGEACHFIDLLRFLAGAPIVSHDSTFIGAAPGVAVRGDKISFTLCFANGSFGTVHYLANGHKAFPKERLEVFCAGRVLQLDNFRRLKGYGWPSFKRMNLWRQDKGQAACVAAFIEALQKGGLSPIPVDELIEVSRVAIEIAQAGS